MSLNIRSSENYIYFLVDGKEFRYPSYRVRVSKNPDGTYNFFYDDVRIASLCGVNISDIEDENGDAFVDLDGFLDANTAGVGSSESNGNTETKEYQPQGFNTGLNNNVPAGFRTVTISRLSGTVTIAINGNSFQLGGGSNPRAITIEGDEYGLVYGTVPAITISGGTWQWIASNTL